MSTRDDTKDQNRAARAVSDEAARVGEQTARAGADVFRRSTETRLEQLKRLPTDLIIVFFEFFGTRAAFGLEM